MEKYINNNQVAVLISLGYGAGWSTWNSNEDFLIMDKTLVKMHLSNTPIEVVKAYCDKILNTDIFMGGWKDIYIEWLDKDTPFTILEHDGNEIIMTPADLDMKA